MYKCKCESSRNSSASIRLMRNANLYDILTADLLIRRIKKEPSKEHTRERRYYTLNIFIRFTEW